MTRIALLAPAPSGAAAGGHTYNRDMLRALRALGHDARLIELSGRFPDADSHAQDASRAAWAALEPDTIPLIDGLALAAFALLPDGWAERAVALIHHPLPLAADAGVRMRMHDQAEMLLPLFAKVVVTYASAKERVAREFGVAEARIAFVAPGVPDAPRAEGTADCAILSLGALVKRKGHDLLLRALARLPDLAWSLTIAGNANRDPAHARELGLLVDELGLAERVRFVDQPDEDTLERLWRDTDLFALAARWDSLSVAREALRRGVPVATMSDDPAHVPLAAGIVCAPGDWETFSKGLRRLIFDRALRRSCADAAWEAGQAFPGWKDQARLLVAALR